MGQVKESERRLINEAAGYHLSDQEEGDYYDAYLKLKMANENGHGNKQAADFVNVWQPLEYKSVNQILDFIESSKHAIEINETENPLANIDWAAFKSQRMTLLDLQNTVSDTYSIEIDGILGLFDAVEDYAIDILGLDVNTVLNINEE